MIFFYITILLLDEEKAKAFFEDSKAQYQASKTVRIADAQDTTAVATACSSNTSFQWDTTGGKPIIGPVPSNQFTRLPVVGRGNMGSRPPTRSSHTDGTPHNTNII